MIMSDQPIHQNKDWDTFWDLQWFSHAQKSDQPIHQNKDWDTFPISLKFWYTFVRPTYPPKQGLRHDGNQSLFIANFASDQPIHQNKDWDTPINSISTPWSFASDQPIHQNKDWDYPPLPRNIGQMTVRPTYPPKQGLRLAENACITKERACQTNLSTKTRIETSYGLLPEAEGTDVRPTYPPKQGLRQFTLSFASWAYPIVRPTYPPRGNSSFILERIAPKTRPNLEKSK